jgi:membrane protease YdiL (CAAX protease family)
MQLSGLPSRIPQKTIIAVLIGFPLISTLLSLLLLNRSVITDLGLDFFDTFWVLITVWYLIQIFLISVILRKSGWSWKDIGYTFTTKKTILFLLGYLVFSFALLFFTEYTLAHGTVDEEKLRTLVSLSPKDTVSRVIFVFMALAAGMAEEFVYRGFAIKALVSNNMNKWLAVCIAAIPFVLQHGIKAYQLNWATWYFVWGVVLGVLFLLLKKLTLNIIIHWLVILSAMVAVLQALVTG